MHDGHGCWASQEAHPCLLLVPIPILQGALLLLPVPDTFVELDGEADNLVITQRPLLLLQDLTAVLIGAIRDLCQGVCCVEISSPFHLIFEKPRDQFVDYVLEGFVRSDTQQRSGFMDLHITHGAVFVGLQVTHDASFAEGMQALHNSGCINEVSPTEGTHEVRVQLRDFDPCGPMHDARSGAGGTGGAWELHSGKWKMNQKPEIQHPPLTALPEPKLLFAFKVGRGVFMWLVLSCPLSVHWVPGGSGDSCDLEQQGHASS